MTNLLADNKLARQSRTVVRNKSTGSFKPCDLEPKDGCIAVAIQVIGNKWTALILRDLAGSTKRFSELERSIPGMSPRTLSQRLDDLEKHSIISRKCLNQVPAHIEYSLTEKGQDLVPILRQMASWGEKYYETR
jgi:DNA-binding HxlR family transcriptional regulator